MRIRNVAVVRAQELEAVGNVHGALAAYREAADRGNPGARVTLGVLLAQRGDAQGAEAEFRVADKAGDPIAAHNLGFLHEERGELAEAQSAYRRSAQRGHASGAMALARLLHEAGDLRGAEEACRRAAELGDVQGARNYTSLLFQRTGETKPGLAAIREAAKRKHSTAPDQPWWRTMPLNAMTDDQKTEAHRQDEGWRRQLQTRMAVIPINPLIGEEILGEAEAQLELNQRWQAELAVAADAAKVETEKDREKLLKLRASTPDRPLPPVVGLDSCRYVGGFPGLPGPVERLQLGLAAPIAVQAHAGSTKPLLRIEWAEIQNLSVGPEQIAERVTTTPILAGRLFAWALKKQQKLACLIVTTARYEAFFEVPLTPIELRAKLSSLVQFIAAIPTRSER